MAGFEAVVAKMGITIKTRLAWSERSDRERAQMFSKQRGRQPLALAVD
jgi:hypothetical protein